MSRRLTPYLSVGHGIPHIGLADGLPTPCHPLEGLAKRWHLPNLFIKRDDQTSSLYGGNKVRKLEFLLGEAQRQRRRVVVTSGALGSHHALATALFAGQLGMQTSLLLFPQPETDHVWQNFAASEATGARIVRLASPLQYPATLAREIARCITHGLGRPYVIPVGGSNALGALGYVEAGLEIAAQVRMGKLPPPSFVYVATGSLATLVGLSIGLGMAAATMPELCATAMVGVRVVPGFVTSQARVRLMQHRTMLYLRRHGARLSSYTPVPIHLLQDFIGPGYGVSTAAAKAAQEDAMEYDGLNVETTYTAKALAGLRAFASKDRQRKNQTHLYIHTLGKLPDAG